jgi:thiamine-monophosphate kinase
MTRTPGPLVIDITATGTVKRRQALTRAGARPGDELYLSGSIGAATAGLQMLRGSAPGQVRLTTDDSRLTTDDRRLTTALFYPFPRVRLGTLLARNRAAAACVDLSDGLADGVRRIADASGVGVAIDADALPIEPAARAWFEAHGADAVDAAVAGGDDYELLFAVRPKQRRRLADASRHAGVTVTRIGVCTPERGTLVMRRDGVDRPIPPGYDHFGR